MRVALTGATGFIGGKLTDSLLADGYEVAALVRRDPDADELREKGAQPVLGDLSDEAALRRLCAGADLLFHLAASRSYWSGDKQRQIELNVGGTRRTLRAAHAAGVPRVVFTSSVAALGVPHDREVADETLAFNAPWCPYHYSKYLSELEAFSWVAKGLEVVAVNPSIVMGVGNIRIDQGTMRAVWEVATGKQKFYPTGGLNVVDVDDVVAGHRAAAEKGRVGQRYILSGDNLSHKEMLFTLARVLDMPGPKLPIPAWLLTAVMAPVEAVSRITGRAPTLTLAHARLSGAFNWFSHEKASRELGYAPRPFIETATAMAAHLRKQRSVA